MNADTPRATPQIVSNAMKHALFFAVFAILFSNLAFSATWYIRPAQSVYGTGDGQSYANAFSGIPFGLASARIAPGDTVYLCGPHYEQMTWNQSGIEGSPVVVDFSCPGDPGSIDTVAAAFPYGVYAANVSYVTFQNMRLQGAWRNAFRLDATLKNVTDVKIVNSVIDNTKASDSTRVCHAVYISPAGTGYRFYNVEISHNVVQGASRNCYNGNNDGINFEGGVSGNVISDNQISKAHEGIDITSAGTLISFNTLLNNYYSGIKVHGIIQCPDSVLMYNNLVSGNSAWGIIFQDAANSIVANNTVNQPNSTFGALQVDRVHLCTQSNNTFTNNIFISSYSAGAVRIYDDSKTAFESQNNWNGNVLYQSNGTLLIYLNTDLANNVTSTNFANKWRGSHARDKNANPNLTSTYRLPPGSPLAGSGITF